MQNKRLVCMGGWFGFSLFIIMVAAFIYCITIEPNLINRIILGLATPIILAHSLVICVVRQKFMKIIRSIKQRVK